MRSLAWLVPIALLFVAAWCEFQTDYSAIARPEEPADLLPLPNTFDPTTCGTIAGRATWRGEKPVATPFLFGSPNPDGNFRIQMMPNPNCPAIDEQSRGVAGAVIFLRGVNPAAAKPWNHKPVRVELQDRGIQIIQGDAPARTGFVRRGDSVAMRSAEPVYHVLRARNAAFFSLAFPEPNEPLTRTFDKAGRVELSSGAGYYWASADLFVTDHPYYALTDRDGRFTFEQVPAGSVEVVAWLPGWDVAKQERDPETGLIFRQTYGPPLEALEKVKLESRGLIEVGIALPGTDK